MPGGLYRFLPWSLNRSHNPDFVPSLRRTRTNIPIPANVTQSRAVMTHRLPPTAATHQRLSMHITRGDPVRSTDQYQSTWNLAQTQPGRVQHAFHLSARHDTFARSYKPSVAAD